MYQLAGQSLKAPLARGLGRLAMAHGIELGAAGIGAGAIAGVHGALAGAAALAPLLTTMSPRLMGEVYYHLGAAARPLKDIPAGTISFLMGLPLSKLAD